MPLCLLRPYMLLCARCGQPRGLLRFVVGVSAVAIGGFDDPVVGSDGQNVVGHGFAGSRFKEKQGRADIRYARVIPWPIAQNSFFTASIQSGTTITSLQRACKTVFATVLSVAWPIITAFNA